MAGQHPVLADVSISVPVTRPFSRNSWGTKYRCCATYIGLWALIIEKENNPSLDIPASLREIDRWVRVINSVIADRSQDVFVMAAISDVMWERGPWNEYRHPTPQEQQEIERYDREGNEYLNAAKKLGWRDVTEEDRESYLDGIRQGKRVDSEGRR